MKHPGLWLTSIACTLLLASCAKNIDNKEAVQDGVRKGVAKRGIDTGQMDVNVTSVQFHGNTADATVAFQSKGQPGNGVTVNYQLERVKDEWVVKTRAPMETMGHTQGAELPGLSSGHGATGNLANSPDGHLMPDTKGKPPLDQGYGTSTDSSAAGHLPPGHPSTGGTGTKP